MNYATNYGTYPNYMNRYSYMPQYQQPIVPQVQQPVQQVFEMPIQAVKFVNEAEAKAYIVMPNTKELLVDRANKVAYLKSADMAGQSNSVMYKFEELKDDVKTEDKTKSFATKDELEKLSKQINDLQKQVKIAHILKDDEVEVENG